MRSGNAILVVAKGGLAFSSEQDIEDVQELIKRAELAKGDRQEIRFQGSVGLSD